MAPGTVAVLGVPWDEESSYASGCALAPAQIRALLQLGAFDLTAESGLDLEESPRFRDLGDLRFESGLPVVEQIEAAAAQILERGAHLLTVGGDHALTHPLLRAHAARYPGLTVVHLDAHPDLYDSYEGSRTSHACPFARVMEEGLVTRLVQIGIRTMNAHQRAQAERFGVEVIEMSAWRSDLTFDLKGPLYLSLDLDVLDPAFAPGVSHHEPGGLSTREVLRLIQGLDAPLVGADLVEYNPRRDIAELTAAVALKFLTEIAAKMLASTSITTDPR